MFLGFDVSAPLSTAGLNDAALARLRRLWSIDPHVRFLGFYLHHSVMGRTSSWTDRSRLSRAPGLTAWQVLFEDGWGTAPIIFAASAARFGHRIFETGCKPATAQQEASRHAATAISCLGQQKVPRGATAYVDLEFLLSHGYPQLDANENIVRNAAGLPVIKAFTPAAVPALETYLLAFLDALAASGYHPGLYIHAKAFQVALPMSDSFKTALNDRDAHIWPYGGPMFENIYEKRSPYFQQHLVGVPSPPVANHAYKARVHFPDSSLSFTEPEWSTNRSVLLQFFPNPQTNRDFTASSNVSVVFGPDIAGATFEYVVDLDASVVADPAFPQSEVRLSALDDVVAVQRADKIEIHIGAATTSLQHSSLSAVGLAPTPFRQFDNVRPGIASTGSFVVIANTTTDGTVWGLALPLPLVGASPDALALNVDANHQEWLARKGSDVVACRLGNGAIKFFFVNRRHRIVVIDWSAGGWSTPVELSDKARVAPMCRLAVQSDPKDLQSGHLTFVGWDGTLLKLDVASGDLQLATSLAACSGRVGAPSIWINALIVAFTLDPAGDLWATSFSRATPPIPLNPIRLAWTPAPAARPTAMVLFQFGQETLAALTLMNGSIDFRRLRVGVSVADDQSFTAEHVASLPQANTKASDWGEWYDPLGPISVMKPASEIAGVSTCDLVAVRADRTVHRLVLTRSPDGALAANDVGKL